MSQHKLLAKAVLRAAEIHEASYVKSDHNYDDIGPGKVWAVGRYTLDIFEASAQALPDDELGARVVGLLLYNSWNDALAWARSVLTASGDGVGDAQEE